MTRAALAAALLAAPAAAVPPPDAAAAAAFAKAHPDLGRRFSAEWRQLLKTLPELREHRDFVLRQRRVELIFSDPGPAIGEDTLASYDPGLVRVNRRWLAWAGHELAARGVPYKDIPGLLAWKLLPVLAHELRHGLTNEEMRAELGRVCTAFVTENEVVSFYDNVKVGRAAVARRPDVFTSDMVLGSVDEDLAGVLAAYKSGKDGLRAHVERLYEGRLSAVSASREDLLKDAEESRAEVARQLEEFRSGDGSVKAAYRDSYGAAPEAKLQESLAFYENCRKVFADPGLGERFRRFYRERMEALAEDWPTPR